MGEIHKVFEHQTGYPIIRESNTLYSWISTPRLREYLDVLDSPEDRTLIQDLVAEYEERVLPKLLTCKRRKSMEKYTEILGNLGSGVYSASASRLCRFV